MSSAVVIRNGKQKAVLSITTSTIITPRKVPGKKLNIRYLKFDFKAV